MCWKPLAYIVLCQFLSQLWLRPHCSQLNSLVCLCPTPHALGAAEQVFPFQYAVWSVNSVIKGAYRQLTIGTSPGTIQSISSLPNSTWHTLRVDFYRQVTGCVQAWGQAMREGSCALAGFAGGIPPLGMHATACGSI